MADCIAAIAPAQYAIKAKIAATVDKDLSVSTVNTTIADGKSYSFYMSGFYDATAKTVEGFVVEDPYPAAIDYTVASTCASSTRSPTRRPMVLWAKSTTVGDSVAIGGTAGIAYKGATGFVPIRGDAYDLVVRYPGSNTAVITLAAQTLSSSRVYTISSRGDITITSTTAASPADPE